MAARLWRIVLGVQAAVCVLVALLITHREPAAAHLWLGVDVVALTFLALQYLGGIVVLAASRALAPAAAKRGRRTDTWRAALGEPIYFLLAQLAMARDARPPSSAAPGSRGPLLLVHGFACNAAVWRWLMPGLRAAGFGPIRALELAPFGADIDALARSVRHELTVLQAQHGVPVTLLAHSLGGLVCRAALHESPREPRLATRLVTVGTPHHGAALAQLGRLAPLEQMRPDSAWLASLNRQPASPVPVTSVFSRDDQFVTPAASAELAGARLEELHGVGHFGLIVSRRGTRRVLLALQATS